MRKIAVSGLSSLLLVLPALVSAEPNLANLIGDASGWLNGLIALLVTLAIVVFFWGLVKYVTNVGDEKSKGLQTMFYGIVVIFVMVSIWGFIRFLQNTVGVNDSNTALPAPTGPTSGSGNTQGAGRGATQQQQ